MREMAGTARAGTTLKVFVSAGETSGDRQAAALLHAVRRLRPELEIQAIGGAHLAAAGADIWLDSRQAAVMGAGAALTRAPTLIPKILKIRKRLSQERPDVAILVDWGGVNVRLARWLRQMVVPTLYYLPPRSWDRRARRDVAFLVDAIATQFPWSKHILSGETARVEWVGHPLVDQVQPKMSKPEAASSFGIDLKRPVVALLPGSRKAEIRHCLPLLRDAAALINNQLPGAQFLLPASEEARRSKLKLLRAFRSKKIDLIILDGMNYDALQCAGAAAAVSGTVTLELALLGIPMVVFYRGSLGAWVQYQIARRTTMQIPFFSLPNLIADRPIVTELVQYQASAKRISEEVVSLLSDAERREKVTVDLASACRQLGPPGAVRRTAEMVMDLAAYGVREPFLQLARTGTRG
ncbi:MAG: lipid-A-disaccharide synthase [Armatimonadetes bacterium]|nr:lipid-A-disaccharide synthase [Armatimonadota bacterium]NIM23669.1 lipid-A-disaccharide synthase [Armatimonadota bacterium]NIM67540.1 lipid-A-disaccharide synthase [Armatimonadota bacterium]NIM76057.1 lipid-A-disaccharide synthase [Armatimonadota bacterium]NIN05727.1 lipid-A-disaccharide synthase [Armatimonadota bacterium]